MIDRIFIFTAAFFLFGSQNAKAVEWACDGKTGLTRPVPVCSKKDPCVNILGTYKYLPTPINVIDTPNQSPPECTITERGVRVGRQVFQDGPPHEIKTSLDGATRHYCAYFPTVANPETKLPVVIFVHGSGGYGDSMYDTTSLRIKAPEFDLTGDPSRKGFILVSLQSRLLHWPTAGPQEGAKFDSYFRDYDANPDVEYLDKVIDELVSKKNADSKRIYLMGWSNGARFTSFYGLYRHHNPTQGGNYVAAISNYSGGDPFENIRDGFSPSCKIASYPESKIPFYMISRNCDGIACNTSQEERIKKDSKDPVTPGNNAQTWMHTLQEKIKNPNAQWQLINIKGKGVNRCTPTFLCSVKFSFFAHLFWPDGHEDKSGRDWEPEMLNFLRDHPLTR